MNQINNYFIDKNIVHKKNLDNVFVYNLRRIIPTIIGKNNFEKNVLSIIEPENKNYLLEYYKLVSHKNIPFLNNDCSEYYILKSIILEIEFEFINNLNMNENDKIYFLNYYKKNDENNKYVLIKYIEEGEEIILLKLLNLKHLIVSNDKKLLISKIIEPLLDKINFLPKENIFFGNMYVNPCHNFFFEHSNEHIPAIMIIETLRQFVMACCHEFGKIPYEGTQIILNSIQVNFNNYADLNYPIEIKGNALKYSSNKEGFWDYLEMDANIVQNNTNILNSKLIGRCISIKLFERLRRKKYSELNNHRFKLYPQFSSKCSLKSISGNKYINTKLLDISVNGFKLNSNDTQKIINEKEGFEFFFHFDDTGFIHGKCKNVWINENKKEAGFQIINISEDDKNKLYSSIGRYFNLIEERELYKGKKK